jgi:hypothetical protein
VGYFEWRIAKAIGVWSSGMTLLEHGSKETWAERLRSRTYPIVYFVIPVLVLLHIVSGHPWKTWVLLGVAMLTLAIWRRPPSD